MRGGSIPTPNQSQQQEHWDKVFDRVLKVCQIHIHYTIYCQYQYDTKRIGENLYKSFLRLWMALNGIKLKYNIHIFKNVTKIPGIIGVEHFVRN